MKSHICECCHCVFNRQGNTPYRFCSPECYFKSKQTTQERACDYCGKTYLPRSERSQKGCCSRDCAFALKKQSNVRACEHCKTEFSPNGKEHRFCSKRCGNTAKRTPAYGRKRRTENFSPVRKRKIKERDYHQCVLCQSTDRIQVDHILPVELGGKSTIDNGQTLCHRCHVEKTTQDRALIRKTRGY